MTSTLNPKPYDPTPPQSVAFLGLGTMGYPMAGHLALAGHRVTVYNRSPAKAQAWLGQLQALRKTGAAQLRSAATPREAATGADVVCCCVGNDDDLRAVALGPLQEPGGARGDDGAFAGMASGAVFVDHTTASAEVARELAQAASARGLHFIDAPVSGGEAGAQNGVLTVMCGGDAAAFARVQPVIGAYARAVTLLGASGAGQLAKMVNQIAVAGVVQGLAEAIAFGERAGLDMAAVLAVLGKGAAQSWQMDNRGPTMIAGKFDYGFAVDLMRKDLALVLGEARRNGAKLPGTALIDQFYADVQQAGGRRWDTSSLITRLR